jgi:hypothetical protein
LIRALTKEVFMASLYAVQRQGWRLGCGDKCVLKHSGKTVECVLVDISISGLLVSCSDDFAESVHPGDVCGINLCGDPLVCPSEIDCKVVRRDSAKIGLQFPFEVRQKRGDCL